MAAKLCQRCKRFVTVQPEPEDVKQLAELAVEQAIQYYRTKIPKTGKIFVCDTMTKEERRRYPAELSCDLIVEYKSPRLENIDIVEYVEVKHTRRGNFHLTTTEWNSLFHYKNYTVFVVWMPTNGKYQHFSLRAHQVKDMMASATFSLGRLFRTQMLEFQQKQHE